MNGATVTLTWSAPAGVSVLDYTIDVRSAPGQPPLVNVSSGGRTSFTATDVPAGTYYISVRAQTFTGFSNPSNEVTVTVTSGAPPPGPTPGTCTSAPGAPTGLRASVAGSTITLSWTAASGSPTGYVVDAGSAPGLSDLASGKDVGSETTVSAPNLPAGTYYVRVRAGNSCGTSSASNEVSVTVAGSPGPPPGTCTTAPGAPSGLSASVAGSTVTLSWTAPSGSPARYLLDAGSAPGLSDLMAGKDVGVETTMSAPNQAAGTFYVRIRATNSCGTGPASNEVSVTVTGGAPPPGPPPGTCTTAPGAPSGLRASSALSPDGNGFTITLSWTAPSGSPASYLLDAGTRPGLSDITSGREVGVETTMSAPNQPGGTYYLRVRAKNSCGTGPASNEVSLTVGGNAGPPGAHCAIAPGAPSGLRASVAGSTITLSWTAPSSGDLTTSYLLDAGSAPGLSDIASAKDVGPDTAMSAPDQPAGTYYMRVRGANNCGTGPASNEVSVTVGGSPPPGPPPGTCTTAPGAPSGLRASVSGSNVTLSWTAPSGSPTSYLLDAGSAPGLSDLASGTEVGPDTTIVLPNQPAGTVYLRIRAKNTCGTGPASNEVRVTVAPT